MGKDYSFGIKTRLLNRILGKESDIVNHGVIPFSVGGSLDFYFYPEYEKGTGVATKEIADPLFSCPYNKLFDAYELIMISPYKQNLESDRDNFDNDLIKISEALNIIGKYAIENVLNVNDTMSFPSNNAESGFRYFILDAFCKPYKQSAYTKNKEFGFMLVIEIFEEEMKFAKKEKGSILLEKMKEKGIYPYSNLKRSSV